ncbi:hypothetical protein, partial [Methylicorpusculum sp.]|uniref:hypothetical protein n=1 Tax=Methylicorpusculum sp. TaxID=2713644 RepID=UPI002ABB6009
MNFTQLFKRRHSLPFFFAALLLVTATIKWTRATGADTTAPTPENTALIFDLDGVVLKKPKIYDPVCKHKSALAKA